MSGKRKVVTVILVFAAFAVASIASFFFLLRPSPLLASFPSTTTASFGHAGDPINIAIVGDKDAITHAFLAAHWLTPDSITASSTLRIAEASIANTAYPTAPVSNLSLFGRAQDVAFELPTGTVRQRHHIRLWKTNETISGKPLWIGSATYDSGIELSGTTAMPTHHISPNVDGERDFVARSLVNAGQTQSESSERIGYPTLWGFNGGGDWYFDDGLVYVLMLR